MDVLGAEAVLVAVFDEPLGGVNHEYALADGGVFLVEHDDAGRYARAVKQVGRQADDALDVTPADDLAADVGLDIAPEQHAVGEVDGGLPGALEAGEHVEQEGEVAILLRRDAELEAMKLVVIRVEPVAPGLEREWRVGDHEIEGLEPPVRASWKCGPASTLSCQISAVGQSWRIIFMRASAAVALSISCP